MSDSRVVIEKFREIVWSLKNLWVLKKSCVIVPGLFVEKFVEICGQFGDLCGDFVEFFRQL